MNKDTQEMLIRIASLAMLLAVELVSLYDEIKRNRSRPND
jgi:hypothetical protein